MEWRAVPEFPDYQISEFGDVRRVVRKKGNFGLRKPYLTNHGYLWIVLRRAGYRRACGIARLVALAFIGPPPTPKHEAAHEDGVPLHNHHSNLRWKTKSENQMDRVRHGTSNRGERHAMCRLDEDRVRRIRTYLSSRNNRQISNLFGVSIGAIAGIREGRSWGWVV